MAIGRKIVGIVLLATSSIVFPQTSDLKPPDAGTNAATASQSSTPLAPNPCTTAKPMDQAEILTDTMGVDFGPYLTQVTKIIRQHWITLIPASVYPPTLKQGKVSIELIILKDGHVSGMVVHVSSGDVALDRAAWVSINASMPFAVLPTEFPGKLIGVRFFFYYNLESDVSPIYISPCADIRVPTGSTLQFSTGRLSSSTPAASGKGIKKNPVMWSVSGPGCSKVACGTISDNGLYTAPTEVPNPPTVTVEAKLQTGTKTPATTQLTVVQANPPQ